MRCAFGVELYVGVGISVLGWSVVDLRQFFARHAKQLCNCFQAMLMKADEGIFRLTPALILRTSYGITVCIHFFRLGCFLAIQYRIVTGLTVLP